MILPLEVIRDYIISNKIEKNLDTNKPIKSLGILKIDKKNNNKKWIIRMKAPEDSLYKNGVFSISIDFPNDFPNSSPKVCFLNKIFHLHVSPSSGHIDVYFLFKWDKTTSITELLVGIYLFFIFPQNPEIAPYSGVAALSYLRGQENYKMKVEEFVYKYAPRTKEDTLLEEISNNEITINNLKQRIMQLENEIIFIKNENKKLKMKENSFNYLRNNYENEINNLKFINYDLTNKIQSFYKNNNNNLLNSKIIKLMEELNLKENELKLLKSKLPFDLGQNEKLMTVIFISPDSKIHYALICKNTDKFNRIENILYEQYPECQESENFFTVNGIKIIKSKTLEENKIKFSDIITLNKFDL